MSESFNYREYPMAQYVVLIYENESDYANAAPEVYGQVMDAHNRLSLIHI